MSRLIFGRAPSCDEKSDENTAKISISRPPMRRVVSSRSLHPPHVRTSSPAGENSTVTGTAPENPMPSAAPNSSGEVLSSTLTEIPVRALHKRATVDSIRKGRPRNGKQRKPSRVHALVEGVQLRHLGHAGRTPGGPQVHKDGPFPGCPLIHLPDSPRRNQGNRPLGSVAGLRAGAGGAAAARAQKPEKNEKKTRARNPGRAPRRTSCNFSSTVFTASSHHA
jgi:hypothetical protein